MDANRNTPASTSPPTPSQRHRSPVRRIASAVIAARAVTARDDGCAALQLVQRIDRAGLAFVRDVDQGGLSGHGHEPQRDEDAAGDQKGDRRRLAPGPPDDHRERSEKGDERQQAQPERDLTADQGAAVRDVVRGNLRRRRAGRSGSLQDMVEEEQHAEQQRADGGQLQGRAARGLSIDAHRTIIGQLPDLGRHIGRSTEPTGRASANRGPRAACRPGHRSCPGRRSAWTAARAENDKTAGQRRSDLRFRWWPGAGSNRRPSDFQSDARTN